MHDSASQQTSQRLLSHSFCSWMSSSFFWQTIIVGVSKRHFKLAATIGTNETPSTDKFSVSLATGVVIVAIVFRQISNVVIVRSQTIIAVLIPKCVVQWADKISIFCCSHCHCHWHHHCVSPHILLLARSFNRLSTSWLRHDQHHTKKVIFSVIHLDQQNRHVLKWCVFLSFSFCCGRFVFQETSFEGDQHLHMRKTKPLSWLRAWNAKVNAWKTKQSHNRFHGIFGASPIKVAAPTWHLPKCPEKRDFLKKEMHVTLLCQSQIDNFWNFLVCIESRGFEAFDKLCHSELNHNIPASTNKVLLCHFGEKESTENTRCVFLSDATGQVWNTISICSLTNSCWASKSFGLRLFKTCFKAQIIKHVPGTPLCVTKLLKKKHNKGMWKMCQCAISHKECEHNAMRRTFMKHFCSNEMSIETLMKKWRCAWHVEFCGFQWTQTNKSCKKSVSMSQTRAHSLQIMTRASQIFEGHITDNVDASAMNTISCSFRAAMSSQVATTCSILFCFKMTVWF